MVFANRSTLCGADWLGYRSEAPNTNQGAIYYKSAGRTVCKSPLISR
jgi:hypothetical protein